jgi:transposase
MANKRLVLKNWTPEKIIELFRQDEKLKLGLKLYAIYLISIGKSTREIEKVYNVNFSFKQISNWFHQFDNEGIDGLLEKQKTGRIAKLTPSQKEELKVILLTQKPFELGFEKKHWTGPLAANLIIRSYNVFYKRAQIYNILKSIGLEYQKGVGFYDLNQTSD